MTLFSAGKLLLCDFNCVHAMFLVYNNPGNLNNVLAMHLVPNSFAFKLPRCRWAVLDCTGQYRACTGRYGTVLGGTRL